MSKGKVLIINNQTAETDALLNILENIGYDTDVCNSISPSLKNGKEIVYHLAIVDASYITGEDFALFENWKNLFGTPILYICSSEKLDTFKLENKNCIERPITVDTVRTQIQDVLRLKAIQDELSEEKEKLAQIFDLTSDEMILTDLNYNIFSQNNRVLDKKDFSYTNFIDLIKSRANSEHIKQLEDFLVSSEKFLNLRFVFDNVLFVKTTISKIMNGNKIKAILIVLEDISQEVEATHMRSCFIDMLNHHLKTPVRAEKRVLQLLLDNSFGELTLEQNDIVQEMYNSSRFMLHMMDNVLTMFKLNSADFSLNISTNSIKKTIQKCVENLNYMFKAKKQSVKICSYIDSDDNCIFDYDEIEIKRVFENIIVNASEHSPISSEIVISIKKVSDFIQVSIKDQGAGIPRESLDSILNDCWYEQRFKKVGSGLGLYITKKIVELHGGELFIISNPPVSSGTECTFSLPCVRKTLVAKV